MARAIWTGAISFGLVTVPVKLYAAVQSKSVKFNQLDGDDHQRIQMKRINASTGEEVPYARIVKGYELSPDRYVIIEPGELEALDPKKTKTIDIDRFVDLAEIDPIHFDHPYYLAPAPGGAKPYRLLVDAMAETGKVAIASVVIRSQEQLVALRPIGDVMAMTTLVYPDEIVNPSTLDEIPAAEDVKTSDKELAIARQLVESLAEPFEPDQYRDTYRTQILDLIERKAAGETVVVQAPEATDDAPVPDLMAALKASLDAVRGQDNGAAKPAGTPANARKRSPVPPGKKTPGGSRKPAAPRTRATSKD
ncbi:MAG: Ku protein [Solirubrobacterales bacterium]|nr:Ku protein [Solirubrobacterales bacterium]